MTLYDATAAYIKEHHPIVFEHSNDITAAPPSTRNHKKGPYRLPRALKHLQQSGTPRRRA